MPTSAARQDEPAAEAKPANAARAIGGEVGKDAPDGANASPARGAARRRRKNTEESKRLAKRNPFGPAYEAACDLLMTALASQRAHDAAQQGAASRPPPSCIDEDTKWRFSSVRTVQQLRANFTPEELRNLSSDLERSLTEKSRALLDGIGNLAYSHAAHEQYLLLMRGLAGQIRIPCALEDLEGKLEEKSAEIGRPASIMDLGPPQLAYPSKKKFRRVVASILGVDERTVRRWESMGDTEYDPRIFKTRNDLIEEDPNKARLAQAIRENLASLAGK